MVKSRNIGEEVKVTNRHCVDTGDIGEAQKT